MTSTQKVIKYVSLAFAIFLIYIIFSAIFSGISMVSEAVNPKYNNDIEVIKGDKKELKDDIKTLKVKLSTTNFSIKAGDKLYIETNNDKIKYGIKNNELIITDKSNFKINKNNYLDLYLPIDLTLDSLDIEAVAGKVIIDSIISNDIDLKLGTGKTVINKVISNELDVEGGAGSIEIKGQINDLDFDMGVGSCKLNLEILNNAEIDAGIGKIDLNLIGDNYKFKVNKGIGKITINNNEMKDNTITGTGTSFIDIDGGIGEINIKTNY